MSHIREVGPRPIKVRGKSRFAVHLVTAVCLSVAAGAGVVALAPSRSAILIALLAIILAGPFAVRVAQGRFDGLEPIVWLNVALAVMFVLHPAAVLGYGLSTFRFDFYAVPDTFDPALGLALGGICAMYLGYFSPAGRKLTRRLPPLGSEFDDGSLLRSAAVFTALGVALYGVAAAKSGISPLTLVSGGIRGEAAGTTAYLYLAPFMIVPAGLIVMKVGVGRKRPLLTAAGIGLLLILVNSLAPSGQRLWVLLIVSSLAVYPMLRSGWRPGPVVLAIVVMTTFVFVVSLRDLDQADLTKGLTGAVTYTVREPGSAVKELLTGPDTEMHNALALEMQFVPRETGFHPGQSVASFLAHPVPRVLWPDKPYPAEAALNKELFSASEGEASVAYSVIGGFYYDSGIVGVLLGMGLLGVLFRAAFEWLKVDSTNDMARLIYALILPFTVILLRGNLPDTAARALFIVGPAVLAAHLAGRRRPEKHPAGARVATS